MENWVNSEFTFWRKGTRTQLNPPSNGLYHLEQMPGAISNLLNCHHNFIIKNYSVYVLDNYNVHIMPDVKAALLKEGYVYMAISGWVTWNI